MVSALRARRSASSRPRGFKPAQSAASRQLADNESTHITPSARRDAAESGDRNAGEAGEAGLVREASKPGKGPEAPPARVSQT